MLMRLVLGTLQVHTLNKRGSNPRAATSFFRTGGCSLSGDGVS